MSHYPTDSMGFFDTIQVFFMELTGRAIMFSGRDLELLSRWRSEGASAAVVCRGLREAVEALGEKELPRDIYNCRKFIEPQVALARSKAVGANEDVEGTVVGKGDDGEGDGIFGEILRNIAEAGQQAVVESVKELYRDAYRRVRALEGEGAAAFGELARVESALVDGFFERLDAEERARIEARILEESRVLVASMSAEAREEHLRARRRLVLIREYGLARLE